MEYQVDCRPDLSERVRYNCADYPIYLKPGHLSWFPNYAAASHWHDDIELIAVLSGQMDYNVNGQIIRMEEGQGIFVNARQLHYGFSREKRECEFICLLLNPVLLCSSLYLEQQYLTPLLSDGSLPCLFLSRETDWQRSVLEDVCRMFACAGGPAPELMYQSLFYDIWWQLYTHISAAPKPQPASNRRLASLKAMISYIEANYHRRITLENIASAGNVGKTTCCSLFSSYIHQTPNVYLVNYRLSKGAELLTRTDLSVTEICYETGFTSASYFTEMFRKSYGCSPTEYRRKQAGS